MYDTNALHLMEAFTLNSHLTPSNKENTRGVKVAILLRINPGQHHFSGRVVGAYGRAVFARV